MKWFCLTLIGIIIVNLSWGDSTNNSAENKLLELLNPLHSFSAQFNQDLLGPDGKLLQSLNGEFHGQKPDKLYWTVFEPASQIIVSNGLRLWVYDPDIEQVIIEPYNHKSEANPISLLLGDIELFSENFELVEHKVFKDSTMQFSLKPLQLDALYNCLIVKFSQNNLSAISFTDNLGQTTHIEFHKFSRNPQFDVNFFNFNIPDGVDVISHVR